MSAEPEYEPTIIPEPDSETEPEPEAELILAESESNAWSEPEPEWNKAFVAWGPAWQIHVFCFGLVFMIMAAIAVAGMVYFLRRRDLNKGGRLTFSLQILIFIFNSVRGLTILIDPYSTEGNLPGILYPFMWSFALPGLTAAFSVLLLVLLDTTKMTLGPPRFQNLRTILIFTTFHFLIVITSSLVFLICESCQGMLLFCQILFILYGLLLGVGYAYSARAIYKNCSAGQGNSESDKVMRLTLVASLASVTSFAIAISHLYAASSVFGLYSDVTYVDHWQWWILQTGLRLEEVFASGLVLYIAKRNPFSECTCKWFVFGKHRIQPCGNDQQSTNTFETCQNTENTMSRSATTKDDGGK